tara:strand:- start:122 stop:481 length:360 start_codon:yes stop_codon:yes gene_type:complete
MVSMETYPNGIVDFQSYAGPGDRGLRSSEVEGYQPVSRIGEVVMNSFVDAYEFTTLRGAISQGFMAGTGPDEPAKVEYKPAFHEWATVQPVRTLASGIRRTLGPLLHAHAHALPFPYRA